MTKEQILNAFLQAEKDWSEPIEKAKENYTHWGLCHYFYLNQNFNINIQDAHLKPLWKKHQTDFDSPWHFFSYGDNPQGRAERIDAIRKVIHDLKTKSND